MTILIAGPDVEKVMKKLAEGDFPDGELIIIDSITEQSEEILNRIATELKGLKNVNANRADNQALQAVSKRKASSLGNSRRGRHTHHPMGGRRRSNARARRRS